MQLIENRRYLDILKRLHGDFPLWEKLNGACIFLSGATGLLGSFLADAVMLRNEGLPPQEQCRLIAVGRSRASAERRFGRWMENPTFYFIEQDITVPLRELPDKPDYWIHAASTSHNYAFATEPINTVLSNVLGTRNILDLVSQQNYGRFLFVSSGEVYGERPAMAALALNADVASMTAVANDYGYGSIFERAVEGLMRPEDVLFGISTSGNSENIYRAMQRSREIGGKSVALLGSSGGKIKDVSDIAIVVPNDITARIQEAHIMIGHIICELIEE